MKVTLLFIGTAAASVLAAPILAAVESVAASQVAVWVALACMVVDRLTQTFFHIRNMKTEIAVLRADVDTIKERFK